MKTLIAALVATTFSFGAFAQASAPAKTMPMNAPMGSTSSMAAPKASPMAMSSDKPMHKTMHHKARRAHKAHKSASMPA